MRTERRSHKRIIRMLYARCITEQDLFYGYADKLSRAGFCITCDQLLKIDEGLEINLKVGPGRTLRLYGLATWKHELPAGAQNPYIYGISLKCPPEEYIEYVNGLILAHDPLVARAG
ncbi:MAG: hypothetical protein P9M14_15005 [Candidatus Alcyoniella australis]|nr:hypothetical protein [Candidatus Alcyoniella australis]